MREELTPRQLAGWIAFYHREPWGFELENLMHGRLLATIANNNPYARKHDYKAGDFQIQTTARRDVKAWMTSPELAAKVRAAFALAGVA